LLPLAHLIQKIPGFSDTSILVAKYIDAGKAHRLMCGSDTQVFALMDSIKSPTNHHPISFSDHFIDRFTPASLKVLVLRKGDFLCLLARYKIRMGGTV
jgi:hypothetical protein